MIESNDPKTSAEEVWWDDEQIGRASYGDGSLRHSPSKKKTKCWDHENDEVL